MSFRPFLPLAFIGDPGEKEAYHVPRVRAESGWIGPYGGNWKRGHKPRSATILSFLLCKKRGCLQTQLEFVNGAFSLTMASDIAGAVAAMTESDPGVESERVSHNTPG